MAGHRAGGHPAGRGRNQRHLTAPERRRGSPARCAPQAARSEAAVPGEVSLLRTARDRSHAEARWHRVLLRCPPSRTGRATVYSLPPQYAAHATPAGHRPRHRLRAGRTPARQRGNAADRARPGPTSASPCHPASRGWSPAWRRNRPPPTRTGASTEARGHASSAARPCARKGTRHSLFDVRPADETGITPTASQYRDAGCEYPPAR